MFERKTVVVTGAASGIGAEICKSFASHGANIVAADIDNENLEKTVEAIARDGNRVTGKILDVTDWKSVEDTANEIVSHYGSIEIWVNCAGISRIIPTLECSEEDWDQILDVNLKGTFLCCRAALAQMIKQETGGVIINFSSQSGKKASDEYAAYCASKFGVIGLTQALALEFAKHRIRVNSVCPGVVETPLWEKQLFDYARKRNLEPEKVMQNFAENIIPLGRLCHYKDVTDMVLFLASDHSSYVTGQAMNLTGGYILH